MKIGQFLSPRSVAALASLAVAGTAAGVYFYVESIPDGYSCEGLLMPKADAAAYVSRLTPNETLDNSKTCVPQWLRAPGAGGEAEEEEEEEEEGGQATDRPDEAIRFRNLTLRDENGHIPFDGLVRAAEHAAAMREADAKDVGAKQITRTSWTSIGPGNIGGRTRAIVVHPTTPTTMWLGSVGGGIWKSTNAGTSWAPQADFLANLAVSSLVIDPANPNILYAGTGEGFYNGDAIQGAGIFKTVNGGTNWTRLASTNNTNFQYVNRVAVSANGATLLAATRNGIFRSTNGGVSFTAAPVLAGEILDVKFSLTNSNLAVAGGRLGKAWWSSNGGLSWTPATGIAAVSDPGNFLGRVELAYGRSAAATVYASVDTSSSNSGALYKSTNGGHSFTLANSGTGYLQSQGWYDNVVWVDPANANRVVVGGVDLWRSVNSGGTLTQISDWREWYNNRSAHADQHTVVSHPGYNGTTNRIVYFGNDGGIYRTNDLLATTTTSGWIEKNNTLAITQFYSAAGNPTTGEIIAGAQDNGSLFYKPTTGAQQWTLANGGDGGFSAADPTNVNYFYSEYVYLTIARSSNRGVSSDDIYSGIGDANGCAYFIAPYILDPNDANRLLAGGCHLWRTNNAKAAGQPTWTQISPWLSSGYGISAIAVLKGNSNIIWVGYGDGSVWKTANGLAASPTWTRVDNNTPPLPNRYVERIAVVGANIAYVTFGGFSPDNVWRTANGGTNWADRTGSGATGLPDAPVRSLVVHPLHSAWLYAGTEVGVFYSEDAGVTWHTPQQGPANVSVDELFFLNNNKIVAATHGRGVFTSSTTTPPPGPQSASIETGPVAN